MRRKNHRKKTLLPDGSRLRMGIVVSEFHKDITGRLLGGALEMLGACKVRKNNIRILRVPGSFEIPFGCLSLIEEKKYNALVSLGCIVKGETDHDIYIALAVSQGIMKLSLEHQMPISLGVITVNTLAQARARSVGETNKGKEAALAAVEMALITK